MKRRCKTCSMIRSTKDLVILEDSSYLCFSCWNKLVTEDTVSEHKGYSFYSDD